MNSTNSTADRLPVMVYGTLRSGGGSNYDYFLAGKTSTERNLRLRGFRMYAGPGCPYTTTASPDESVVVTLMDIAPDEYDETMKRLDMLEGFQGFGNEHNYYDRKKVSFTLEGEKVYAWMYLVSYSLLPDIHSENPIVPDGDWLAHKQRTRRS